MAERPRNLRKVVTLDAVILDAIERFRRSDSMQPSACPTCGHTAKTRTESDAIRRLIEMGLKQYEQAQAEVTKP
jgi:hypothetical protein